MLSRASPSEYSHLVFPDKDLSPSDTDEIGGHTSGGEGRNSRMGASTDIDTLIKVKRFCTAKYKVLIIFYDNL